MDRRKITFLIIYCSKKICLQTERSDIIMHDDHITILIWALSLFIITAESWAWNHVSILSEHNYQDTVCPHILSRMLWYNVRWLHAMCFTGHLQERSCNQECFHSLHICIVLCKKDHSRDKSSWPSHDRTLYSHTWQTPALLVGLACQDT